MKFLIILPLIFLITFNVQATLVQTNRMDFTVYPEKLRSNTMYSIKFYKPNNSLSENLELFDVENLKDKYNTRLVFLKSAFLVNKTVEEINDAHFFNPHKLGKVFQSTYQSTISDNKWSMKMKVSIKKIRYNLTTFVTNKNTQDELVNKYIEASEYFDTQFAPTDRYIIQILDNYSELVKKMMIVTKLIPYEDKTLVLTYQFSDLNNRLYKKLNIFNIVKKTFIKKAKQTLETSRKIINSH